MYFFHFFLLLFSCSFHGNTPGRIGHRISLFDPLRHDAFQKEGQVTTLNVTASLRHDELSFFQAFIPQRQTVLIPIQQLDHFTVAVDENEQ